MRAISTILPIHSPIRKLLLPRQRLSSNPDRPDIPTSVSPLLPRLNIPVVDKVAMETQLQLQRQVNHSQRPLGQILRVKDGYIVPQLVEPIHERYQVPLSLGRVVTPGDEARLLYRRRGPEEVRVLGAARQRVVWVPGIVSQAIEEAASGGSTLLKVVRLRRVDLGLPKVLISILMEILAFK